MNYKIEIDLHLAIVLVISPYAKSHLSYLDYTDDYTYTEKDDLFMLLLNVLNEI
jgi:hypothetical protein